MKVARHEMPGGWNEKPVPEGTVSSVHRAWRRDCPDTEQNLAIRIIPFPRDGS